MNKLLRFSEHPLAVQWLEFFRPDDDKRLAARLLDQLTRVSLREFETRIEGELVRLQKRLGSTIAVFPVAPPLSPGVKFVDAFEGGQVNEDGGAPREAGRRRRYGSEDRLGHFLTKLEAQLRRTTGASFIEANPTVKHVKKSGIKHIVLVDDFAGSGKRITDYWRSIPRSYKSLLSLKKLHLWIVVYAVTPVAKSKISSTMPNFPMENLISVVPLHDTRALITSEIRTLCEKYSKIISSKTPPLGFRGATCTLVFEHGCPNNVPAIFHAKTVSWQGIFPNRAIPASLRPYFDEDSSERELEALWRSNRVPLAMRLLEALERKEPISALERLTLTFVALRLRGVAENVIQSRLILDNEYFLKIRNTAADLTLYDRVGSTVTAIGREFVFRYQQRYSREKRKLVIGKSPVEYYPTQCEGEFSKLGKADSSAPQGAL